MNRLENKNGMTVMEILIVAGIMSLLIVIAGSMVSKFTISRTIDDMARSMSSTIQMAKLKSARDGVEYRAVFATCTDLDESDPDCTRCNTYVDYSPGDDTITLSLERGDSNKGSVDWCIESAHTKEVPVSMDIDLTNIPETIPVRCNFSPVGLAVDQNGSMVAGTFPVVINPSSGARVKRCGRVIVAPFGGVSVIHGNWDGTDCNPIRK